MDTYIIEIVIENKPAAKDPEGATIQRDLLNKGGYDQVTSVRTGKFIRVKVKAENSKAAEDLTLKFCNDLRIYNPVVHTIRIDLKGTEK
ncbi:MAG: phosphoribosylformylglycinamidine synthase subunit PurS [Candidatus Helarchaeota archaeon]